MSCGNTEQKMGGTDPIGATEYYAQQMGLPMTLGMDLETASKMGNNMGMGMGMSMGMDMSLSNANHLSHSSSLGSYQNPMPEDEYFRYMQTQSQTFPGMDYNYMQYQAPAMYQQQQQQQQQRHLAGSYNGNNSNRYQSSPYPNASMIYSKPSYNGSETNSSHMECECKEQTSDSNSLSQEQSESAEMEHAQSKRSGDPGYASDMHSTESFGCPQSAEQVSGMCAAGHMDLMGGSTYSPNMSHICGSPPTADLRAMYSQPPPPTYQPPPTFTPPPCFPPQPSYQPSCQPVYQPSYQPSYPAPSNPSYAQMPQDSNCIDIEGFIKQVLAKQHQCHPNCLTSPSPPCLGYGMAQGAGQGPGPAAGMSRNTSNAAPPRLQDQTVYSTDYKPVNMPGNSFNHFPKCDTCGNNTSSDGCSTCCNCMSHTPPTR